MTWSPREPRPVTTCTPLDTRGPKRLWNEPAGLVTRDRGDVGRLVRHDYRCPVHGVFEARVSSESVPDEMPCPRSDPDDASAAEGCELVNAGYDPEHCGLTSPWSPSVAAIWPSSGEVRG